MVNKFSSQIINSTLQTVLIKYNLKPGYLMSTSGEFLVMTLNRGQQKFIIKIILNKSVAAQKKFKNEVAILKFLQNVKIRGLLTPKIYIANTKVSPSYLIYNYINGYPLNDFYISIGQRLTEKFLATDFIKILNNLQKIKIPKKISLQKNYPAANLKMFNTNLPYLKKYFNQIFIKKIYSLLRLRKKFLNSQPLKLTHGDINPKNLVLDQKNLAIIDWSEVHLNNPLFDLSNLYLFAWNRPNIREVIRQFILNECLHLTNPYHLFLLNRLILLPRNIRIMENSLSGLALDKKNKKILPITEKKLKKVANLAIQNYLAEINWLVEYLELWQKPKSIAKTIEKLYHLPTAIEFMFSHQKKMGLGNDWQLKKITTHRLTVRRGDQKFIAEFTFQKRKKIKTIMGKIRMERNDDLARQSYQIIKTIWEIPAGKKLISRPLYYFSKDHLYVYEKTLGQSLTNFIEIKTNQNQLSLSPLIKKSAKIMSRLHQLPINHFAKVKFYNNYDLNQQLYWLEKNIKKNKKFFSSKNINFLNNLKKLHEDISQQRANKRSFIHGDYQLQNLILDHLRLRLIDFDNAEINDPLIDVGNFLNQINYKNLLYKNSHYLRTLFLKTYLDLTKQKLDDVLILCINFYIIMGTVKNINLNFLENKPDLVTYDIKKIQYLYRHLKINPLDNLRNVKIILTKSLKN